MSTLKALAGVCVFLAVSATPCVAQIEATERASDTRVALDDMWWTGPMLANSASTLPRGHALFEPYVYDVATAGSDGYGSRSYVLYGVTDRLTAGLIPVLGFTAPHEGLRSSHVGFGDLTLLAQYGLTRFRPDRRLPAVAVMVQETLPTGRFDRLGDRPSDGFGAGAYTATIGFNAQTYVWLPTGRALRMRLNVSEAVSRRAAIEGASVYGTPAGFRGNATPGHVFFADASWEYSLVRRVAVAADVFYTRSANTRVEGLDMPPSSPASVFVRDSGVSRAVGVAPAVELSMTPNLGVLLGIRVIPGGGGTARSMTPAIAINVVR